ncbi:MAG: thioredoxin [Elusimicrobiota bacterium]|nr:thioredoxin [Elusimicrobiota bacterium]
MIELNDDNFEKEVLESDIPVLVDFWAEWCAPCLMVAPAVAKIAKDNEGKLKVCKLNVDDARATAAKYGIMSIPTLAVFNNGEVADKAVGALPKEAIMEKIQPFLD